MKKLKLVLFSLAAVMLLGTAHVSAFNADFHVKQAPNNKGDLLFFPFYGAMDTGYSTKLTVVNTSNEYSTVAKLVVRSRDWSEELIDFLIYLSPNDMWTGELVWVPNPPSGRSAVTVISTDDSVITELAAPLLPVAELAPMFASPANPFEFRLFPVTCPGDTERIGYVEVIASRAGSCATDPLLCKLADGTVPKPNIYKWYHGPDSSNPFGVEPDFVTQGPKNILAGWLEFNRPMNAMTASMRAETFADWYNIADLTVADVEGIEADSLNTVAELEAAMAKLDIAMPYLNYQNSKSIHVLNFPTKLSTRNRTVRADGTCNYNNGNDLSPYFYGFDRAEELFTTVYDMKENTVTTTGDPISGGDVDRRKVDREVEYLGTDKFEIPFEEGWVRYNFARTGMIKSDSTEGGNDIRYLGTPVLPAILNFNHGGLSLMKAAYDDGSVAVDGVRQFYYQYSDGFSYQTVAD